MYFRHQKLNFYSFLELVNSRFNRYIFIFLLCSFPFFATPAVVESKSCREAFIKKNSKPPLVQNQNKKWKAVQVEDTVRQEAQKKLWSIVKNPSSTKQLDEKLYELVENGADPYATDSNGWTPLDYAVSSGDLELVHAIHNIAKKTININGEYSYWVKLFKSIRSSDLSLLSGYSASDYEKAISIAKEKLSNILITNTEMEQNSLLMLNSPIGLYLLEQKETQEIKLSLAKSFALSVGLSMIGVANIGMSYNVPDPFQTSNIIIALGFFGIAAINNFDMRQKANELKKKVHE